MSEPRRGAPGSFGLGLLFGTIYFIQGIGEPTEGLIAQPVRSMLSNWGHSAGEIAAFAAVLSVPWVLKPLYGLLTDFVPILGSHRRAYLLICGAAATLGLGYLYLDAPVPGAHHRLLLILLVPTVAIAFSDVVADALMVETGKPRGLTGQLQAVQWACLYGATIVTGALGGYLSQHGRQDLGFLICAAATLGTVLLAVLVVREAPRPRPARGVRPALAALLGTLRTPAIIAVAAFLFLWNFNPFSTAVLYVHMTRELGYSEQFYGNTVSVLSIAAVAASVAYGLYCRRVAFRRLVHAAIAAGVVSTLAYLAMHDEFSAMAVTVAVGVAYMTGTLVQLDLAARVCPDETAGTTFALLMAVSNLGLALSTGIGGALYDRFGAAYGAAAAFQLLIAVGAGCTALCWLLVPVLHRHALRFAPQAATGN